MHTSITVPCVKNGNVIVRDKISLSDLGIKKVKKDAGCCTMRGSKENQSMIMLNVTIYPISFFLPQASLVERLKVGVCELCGNKAPLTMHHVRHLVS